MGKIFSKIKGLISKLLMIVAIIIVAIIIINWGSGDIIFGLKAWQLGLLAAIAVGLAFIIDGDQAAKMVGSIKTGATKIVEAAGDVLGSAVSTVGRVVTSTIGSWIVPIGLVLGGYYIFTREDENDIKK